MPALVGVSLAASTLVAAPAAYAGTHSYYDAHGDVSHGMDIQHVTVQNGNPLVITIKHRSIPHSFRAWSGAYIDVSPRGVSSPDYLFAGGVGNEYQFSIMQGWTKVLSHPRCSYRETVNYQLNTTRFAISRGCLNGANFMARRIRVAAIGGIDGRRTDWAPGYRTYSSWVPYR